MLRSITAKVGRRGLQQQSAALSSLHTTIKSHDSPAAAVPLMEHYRPRWPQLPIPRPAAKDEFDGIMPVPVARAISPSIMRFEMSATFSHGGSIYYEHMAFNPVDFKVGLKVLVADLNLTEDERHIFIRMVGLRYNTGKREVRLTCDRFPNRIENKRYLIYLLENLVMEATNLAVIQRSEEFNTPKVIVHENDPKI